MTKGLTPPILTPSPAQKEQEAENQKKWERLAKARTRLSPQERQIIRGRELERHHRLTRHYDGIAEALAMQGRFAEASKIAIRDDLKAEYAELAKADEIDDIPCGCDKIDAKGQPTEFVLRDAFSEKHQKFIPFIKCTICGEVNTRTPSSELQKLRNKRKEAVAQLN